MSSVRLFTDADRPFIRSTWWENIRASGAPGILPTGVARRAYTQAIDAILDRDNTRVLIRYWQGKPGLIVSYLVLEAGHSKPVVHWAYTRGAFTGQGAFLDLMKSAGIKSETEFIFTATHVDRRVLKRIKLRFPGLHKDKSYAKGAKVAPLEAN